MIKDSSSKYVVMLIIILSISQFLTLTGLTFKNSSEHDDFSILYRLGQHGYDKQKALNTDPPVEALKDLSSDFLIKRIIIHNDDHTNHPLHKHFYSLFLNKTNKKTTRPNFANELFLMFSFSFTITLFIFIFCLFIINEKKWYLYVFSSLFISVNIWYACVLFNIPVYDQHILGNELFFRSKLDWVFQIPNLLFRPRYNMSIFSYAPRNNFIFILFGVFILRWSNYHKLSYWLLLIASLFHAAMGLVFLLFITGIDIMKKLFSGLTQYNLMAIILNFTIITINSHLMISLLKYFSINRFIIFLFLGLIGLILLFLYYISKNEKPLFKLSSRIGNIISKDIILSDLFYFAVIWITALPLVIFLNSIADSFSSTYVWSHLLGRPLAMMHLPIILAIVIYFAKLTKKKGLLIKYYSDSFWKRIFQSGAILAIIIWTLGGIYILDRGFSTLNNVVNEFDKKLDKPFNSFNDEQKDEAFLFYTSIKSFEDNTNYFKLILPSKE